MKVTKETRYGTDFEGPRGVGGVYQNNGVLGGTYYEAWAHITDTDEFKKLATRATYQKAVALVEKEIG